MNCHPTEELMPVFNIQINLNVLNQDKEYPELVYKLLAPLVLENLLPFAFRYILQDRVTKQQISGTLKSGEMDYLHITDTNRMITLSLMIVEKGFLF